MEEQSGAELFNDMLDQIHLLIAGVAGTGKTWLLENLIGAMAKRNPEDRNGGAKAFLIDPELSGISDYAKLPHVIGYARAETDIAVTLRQIMNVIEYREKNAKRSRGDGTCDGADIFVFIDDLPCLTRADRQDIIPLLFRIMLHGRGSRVHVIATTRTARASVIPSEIISGFTASFAFRTQDARDSETIIGLPACGAQKLNLHEGLYRTPDNNEPKMIRFV